MARVNVGIDPKVLSDQHLIAESVELTMITGSLRVNDYKIKSKIPTEFTLGKGHMNFFKDKLIYLHNRLEAVNSEMQDRGFSPGTHINLKEFPKNLLNNWKPTSTATLIVRERVIERLIKPKSGKKGEEYHRYCSKVIGRRLHRFCTNVLNSELHYV